MTKPDFLVQPESPDDVQAIAALNARAFGPGRFTRTAYRIRETGRPADGLSFIARSDGRLAGSIRFTALSIGGRAGALLLGPLAVEPDFAGQGCGRKLIAHGLEAAREKKYRLVVLVGDLSYYARAGFEAVPPGQITLPGPVDPARLLAYELEDGALADYAGSVVAV